MYLAYVDESGNAGWSGTHTYTLGCVFMTGRAWPETFDQLLAFRRWVRKRFGPLLRDEIKANHLIRNGGPLPRYNLGDGLRHVIYRQHMRLIHKIGLRAFGVVIVKERIRKRTMDPRDTAWRYLIQRLERLSSAEEEPVLLMHDEGDTKTVRKLARQARRAGTAGATFPGADYLERPFEMLIDDPVPKNSEQSFFVQLADLVAYAGFRKVFPPGEKPGRVCPQDMWDEIGDGLYEEATRLRGSIPGLVVWPT